MKFLNIFLLILIIIGAGLLFTRDQWVPRVVDMIMAREQTPPPFVLERPVASSTTPAKEKDSPQTMSFSSVGVSITPQSVWSKKSEDSSAILNRVSLRSTERPVIVDGEPSYNGLFVITRLTKGNKEKLSLNEWLFEELSPYFSEKKYMVIDGRDAIQVTVSEIGGPYAVTYVLDGEDVIDFSYSIGEPRFISENEAILKSVRFLPKTSFLYGEAVLKVGETAKFSGVTLTLVRVFDDSRCPTGVTCIWAGTVKAEVKIVSGMGISTSTVELENTVITEAEEIAFLSATPHPKEGVGIPSGEYHLTFRVEKRP